MGCTPSREIKPKIKRVPPGHQLVNVVTDRDIHDVYDFTGPVLGKGAFATVLRVRDRKSGSEYAVKQIELSALQDNHTALRMMDNEVRTMKTLSHPNIVRLQEVYRPTSGDTLYLVLDRLEGGSVDGLWREQGRLSEDHAAHIVLQVVSAVRYCHDRNIAHRDLKMENSLFEDASPIPIVKVIDFGLSTEIKHGVSSRAFVGTILYTAPEILKVAGHGLACDIWSVGVMAFALVGGYFPWSHEVADICGNLIKYSPLKFSDEVWSNVSPLCKDFIEKCLIKAPKKRITAAKAHEHPWLGRAQRAMEGAPLSKGAMMAMMNYQNGNSFKRIAMELVAHSYEPSQIKDLELIFLQMDTTGQGAISLKQFKDALLARWDGMNHSFVSTKNNKSEASRSASSGTVETSDKTLAKPNTIITVPGQGDEGYPPTLTSTTTTVQDPALAVDNDNMVTPSASSLPKPPPPSETKAMTEESAVDHAALHSALLALQVQEDVEAVHTSKLKGDDEIVQTRKDRLTRVLSASYRQRNRPQQRHDSVASSSVSVGELPALAKRNSGMISIDNTLLGGRPRLGLQVSSGYLDNSGASSKALVLSGGDNLSRRSSVESTGAVAEDVSRMSLIKTDPMMLNWQNSRAVTLDEQKVEEIFKAMDHDHSGSITFTDFVAGCLVEKQMGEAAIRTAFDRLDHSRSGLITLEDVAVYLEDFDEEDMKFSMSSVSSKDDAQVSYKDFKKCLLGGALPRSRSRTPRKSASTFFRRTSEDNLSGTPDRRADTMTRLFPSSRSLTASGRSTPKLDLDTDNAPQQGTDQ